MIRFLLMLSFAMLLVSCAHKQKETAVWFDNDADFDDLIALMLLSGDATHKLKVVSFAPTGWGKAVAGCEHNIAVLGLNKQRSTDVLLGVNRPYMLPPLTPTQARAFREVKEALNGVLESALADIPRISARQCEAHGLKAIEYLVKMLKDTREPLTVVATGPLTNLAAVYRRAPALMLAKVKHIFYLGQSIKRPHQLHLPSNNQLDAMAAKIIFDSKIPITLIDNKVAHKVPLTKELMSAMNASSKPKVKAALALMKKAAESEPDVQLFLWDIVAAVVFLDPNIVLQQQSDQSLTIDTTGIGTSFGKTIYSGRKYGNHTVVGEVDVDRVYRAFCKRLDRTLKCAHQE